MKVLLDTCVLYGTNTKFLINMCLFASTTIAVAAVARRERQHFRCSSNDPTQVMSVARLLALPEWAELSKITIQKIPVRLLFKHTGVQKKPKESAQK